MRILIVDDERKIADAMAERFRIRGLDAVAVYDGGAALKLLGKEPFDGMVLDLRLPDVDGVDVLLWTMKEFPEMKVVILSGHASDQEFQTCLEFGAKACFHKPANLFQLTEAFGKECFEGDQDI